MGFSAFLRKKGGIGRKTCTVVVVQRAVSGMCLTSDHAGKSFYNPLRKIFFLYLQKSGEYAIMRETKGCVSWSKH
jgi:hypothetical protein